MRVLFFFKVIVVIFVVLVLSVMLFVGLLFVFSDCSNLIVFIIDWLKVLLVVNKFSGDIIFDVGVLGKIKFLI